MRSALDGGDGLPHFFEAFPNQSVEAVGALLERPHLEYFLRRRLGNGAQLNSAFRLRRNSLFERFGIALDEPLR
jgi:hypothetical protein